MSVSDTLGDSLTRLRNAYSARRKSVFLIDSKFVLSVFNVLSDAGYVGEVSRLEKDKKGLIAVKLRYSSSCSPALKFVTRISKPGKKVYAAAKDVGSCNRGLGLRLLSTSKGVMPSYEAKKLGIGGEILCDVF